MRAAQGSGRALARPCPAHRRQAARWGSDETAAAGDPDAQHELRIRMDGRHDPRVRQLWSEGHSTAEIGRRMGVTKNAVVGKAHRLDLPARPSPIRSGGSPRPSSAPRRQPVPRLADTMPLSSLRDANVPRPSNALLRRPHQQDGSRSHHGGLVCTRAAGRLGSQARRHFGSVMTGAARRAVLRRACTSRLQTSSPTRHNG